jgi:hypothetical protein
MKAGSASLGSTALLSEPYNVACKLFFSEGWHMKDGTLR